MYCCVWLANKCDMKSEGHFSDQQQLELRQRHSAGIISATGITVPRLSNGALVSGCAAVSAAASQQGHRRLYWTPLAAD